MKNEREDTLSIKVAFYKQRLHDEIYSNWLKLKGTNVFIEEDLTPKKASLAYEARKYAKNTTNASTWTMEGTVFLKDNTDAKPRAIHDTNNLHPDEQQNEINKA